MGSRKLHLTRCQAPKVETSLQESGLSALGSWIGHGGEMPYSIAD